MSRQQTNGLWDICGTCPTRDVKNSDFTEKRDPTKTSSNTINKEINQLIQSCTRKHFRGGVPHVPHVPHNCEQQQNPPTERPKEPSVIRTRPSTAEQHQAYREGRCITCLTARHSAGRPRCSSCHIAAFPSIAPATPVRSSSWADLFADTDPPASVNTSSSPGEALEWELAPDGGDDL